MSHQDFYRGPTSDILKHGVPKVSTSKGYRTSEYHATEPGAVAILKTHAGADVSKTFLVNWIKGSKKETTAFTLVPANGFLHPNPLGDV